MLHISLSLPLVVCTSRCLCLSLSLPLSLCNSVPVSHAHRPWQSLASQLCHETPTDAPTPYSTASEVLLQLRSAVARVVEQPREEPTYALVNIYRDGSDSIGWHADDANGVLPDSSIASISLGASRRFAFRPYVPGVRGRTEAWPQVSVLLESGSLLLMGPQTNEWWCHSLAPDPSISTVRALSCLSIWWMWCHMDDE